VSREDKISSLFPGLKFVGNTSNGVVIQDKNEIIEIKITNSNFSCNKDKGICKHILFTCINPSFDP